jgi:hypothetical protein
LVKYCGRGVSVARHHYYARKRLGESPLEYLHLLNVAGLRAKLPIKKYHVTSRREDVKHFIETLDNRDLADHLALLRLLGADVLEETLRARQRAKNHQGTAVLDRSSSDRRLQPHRSLHAQSERYVPRRKCSVSRTPTMLDRKRPCTRSTCS